MRLHNSNTKPENQPAAGQASHLDCGVSCSANSAAKLIEVDEMKIEFKYNGIKVDGKLYGAWYSETTSPKYPAGTITIYGKHYQSFPVIEGLNAENNSDSMTDYFENDTIRIEPTNVFFAQAVEAVKMLNIHNAKLRVKREERYNAIQHRRTMNMQKSITQAILNS